MPNARPTASTTGSTPRAAAKRAPKHTVAPTAPAATTTTPTEPPRETPRITQIVGLIFSLKGKRVLLREDRALKNSPIHERTLHARLMTDDSDELTAMVAEAHAAGMQQDRTDWTDVAVMHRHQDTTQYYAASASTDTAPRGWKWYRTLDVLRRIDDDIDALAFTATLALRGGDLGLEMTFHEG